jgi:hypothetical protein
VKFLLLGMVASLCALALYPVVLSVGLRVSQKLKAIQDKKVTEEEEEPTDGKDD